MDQRGGRSWEGLGARENDAAVAEWMGWTDVAERPCYEWSNTAQRYELFGVPPGQAYKVLVPYFTADVPPIGKDEDCFDESRATVRQVEDEVERRGLQDEYLIALGLVLWGDWGINQDIELDNVWSLLRATPDQKCQAALRAGGVDV